MGCFGNYVGIPTYVTRLSKWMQVRRHYRCVLCIKMEAKDNLKSVNLKPPYVVLCAFRSPYGYAKKKKTWIFAGSLNMALVQPTLFFLTDGVMSDQRSFP